MRYAVRMRDHLWFLTEARGETAKQPRGQGKVDDCATVFGHLCEGEYFHVYMKKKKNVLNSPEAKKVF